MIDVFGAQRKPKLEPVWLWYEFQRELIADVEARVRAILAGSVPSASLKPPLNELLAKTPEEAETFILRQRTRLDFVAMLDLLTTAEAALRSDFDSRADRKRKDPVSRRFRDLRNKYGKKVRLEDILDAWKERSTIVKRAVGDFKGVLKLRDWLAHGRRGTPKLGREYTPGDVFDIASSLLNSIASA